MKVKMFFLAFNSDIAKALKSDSFRDPDDEATILAKPARIIRKDIFEMNHQGFKGNFKQNTQDAFIPHTLKTLIKMITNGANINAQANTTVLQPVLSIAQLIISNSFVRRREDSFSLTGRVFKPYCSSNTSKSTILFI